MIQSAAYRVLFCFLTSDTLSFSTLCKEAGYPTDLGGYYIRRLVSGGYLTKSDRGQYTITAKGKQQIARANGKQQFTVRPRLTVLVVATYADKLALIKRQRQPFIGTIEWPAGAVQLGESLPDAANRMLNERLGSSGDISFSGFFRRIDFFKNADNIFDDKLFAVFTAHIETEPTVKATSLGDEIILHTKDTLAELPRKAKSLIDILLFTESATGTYTEHTYILTEEDIAL